VEWWRHYPWSSAHAHHKPKPYLTCSQLMPICTHFITREWLDVIWWNLFGRCHLCRLQTHNFQLSRSVIPTRQLLEVVRWNDDATTHDFLRTEPLHKWCLFAFRSSRVVGRKLMKLGVNVMPLVTTANSYLETSYTRLYQLDGCLKSWGGMMITPLPMILCACASLT
jgi:hypothetical protein